MERRVTLKSDGIDIAGVLHIPDGHKPGRKLPAFIVLHGFMGSKDESHAEIQARMLEGWGYAALRIDFRGLGESGGERGYVLCMDQVADTRNALTWLAGQPEIDPKRIGVTGHSFGAAVSVYTGGVDERVACCHLVVRLGPWRAQVSWPASRRGELEDVHRHAGARSRAQGQDRRAVVGVALGGGAYP